MIEAKNITNALDENSETSASDVVLRELAPLIDWSVIGEPEHFVQFYETDAFLLDSLSGFVGTGLSSGDACIVVATEEHRTGLEKRLEKYGLDIAAARASGQFVSFDAAGMLAKFMVDGMPDAGRFVELLGALIGRAAEGRSRVRIFGEMVALLWADGNNEAAIQLEGFWNDLHKIRAFSLYCAYPINGFGGEMLAAGLNDVCTAHSRVIPAESYSGLNSTDERLRAILQLQQKARSLEAEIAERKEAEERLRVSLVQEQMARAEAEHANRLKDEFLATASHELRTPLNAIIGWSYMLRNSRLDEETVTRAVEIIERNAKSQAQLVEDILDVSRVITGKLRLNIEPVDIASVINAAIDAVQLAADTKGIQLEVTLDPSARHVSGDSSRLQQVVWNLLSNAIKFTPSGGRVRVRLERVNSNVQIRISDSGEGIQPDFLPFIFDRFRQADGTSTRRHGGLGLGLAIVRHLIELHGGIVHADSPGEGQGATFTISLPLPTAPKRSNSRKKKTQSVLSNEEGNVLAKSTPSLVGVKVLLVDDDKDTVSMLATMLAEHEAIIQTASSAEAALEMIDWYKPDVLVSDLAMPHEDGYSLIAKLRSKEAASGKMTPAVALTAYVRIEDRARALSAGFNMFVPKPVEPSELITAIAHLVQATTTDMLLSRPEIM